MKNQSSCSVPAPEVSLKRKRDYPSENEYVPPAMAAQSPGPFEARGVLEPVVLQPVKPDSATASVKAPSLLTQPAYMAASQIESGMSSLKTLPDESGLTPEQAEDSCNSLLCDHPEAVNPSLSDESASIPCPFVARGALEPVVLQPVKPDSAIASVKAPSLLTQPAHTAASQIESGMSSLKILPDESVLTPEQAEDFCNSLLCDHPDAVDPSLPDESASILCPSEARGASGPVVLHSVKPNSLTAAVKSPSLLNQSAEAASQMESEMSSLKVLTDEPDLTPEQVEEFCNSLLCEDFEDVYASSFYESASIPHSLTFGRELFRMGEAVLEDFEVWWKAEGQYQEFKKQKC